MSNLIEQAVRRLAQLKQVGVEIPESRLSQAEREGGLPSKAEESPVTPGMLVETEDAQPDLAESTPAMAGPILSRSGMRSKRVELDLEAIAASGMVSPLMPGSQIAEQYRIIKRPLLANAVGKGATPPVANGNLIMVTSALPREGKTFNAINLAMSIATELDHTVMLVDADVARPSVLQLLGLPAEPGLLDLLQDDSLSLSSVLLRTNVEKLSLLPSGTPHTQATELLASDAMIRLLNDMAGRYANRIIIFDSPPLLVTTESHVLASHMGQIVMVIEAERTLESEVMQALTTIEGCPVKQMILNKARVEFKKGYSYGYAYGYG